MEVSNQNETDTPLTTHLTHHTSNLTHLTSSDETKPLKKPDFPLIISLLYDRLNFEFIISFVRSYTSKTPGWEGRQDTQVHILKKPIIILCRDSRISF